MKTSVKTAVRIRPFITDDQPHDVMCVSALPHLNQVALSGQKCFTVDYALPVSYTQNQVFEVSVQPMVKYILQGFDISVVAYGQKNSGKTYTIFGPGLHCAFSEIDYGVIPRTTREIFNQLLHGTRKYKVTVTFIEIFGESIRDLLGTSQINPVLGMKYGRTSVCHVNEIECHNVSEVFNCLHVGMSNRQASEHAMNLRPSCGHSVFTLFLEQECIINGVQQLVCSQAQFTDLAGSNTLFQNIVGDTSGTQRLHYDNGLLALENMIVALSDPSSEHASIFYMNTVLTRILKNSFGGNAYTLLICCVSPASLDISETVHSLQLAAQGRNVRNFLAMTVFNNSTTFCVNSPEREISEEKLNVTEKQTTDVFGLSFAASQWLKLVASAERLFTELTSSAILSTKMKEQIEHWLCLKQECEECIECDIVMNDSVGESRVLYRIDELTEPEERNSVVDVPQTECSENGSPVVMCDFLLDGNVGFPEFPEKLDGCIKLFKNHVDNSVKLIEENFALDNSDVQDSNLNGDSILNSSLEDLQDTNDIISDQQVCVSYPLFPSKQLSTRRNSICHGASSPEVMVPKLQLNDDLEKIDEKDNEIVTEQKGEIPFMSSSIIYHSGDLQNMLKELKLLTEESCDEPTKCQQMIIELEDSLNEIEKLKQSIWRKQQHVGNLIKNEIRESQKHFHQNSNKLLSEYHIMRSPEFLTENCVRLIDIDNRNQENLQNASREIKKLSHCTEKFPNEVNTKKNTGYSKIISESETNYEMNKLRMELLKEVKHVHELEKEIAADKEKIEDLQEKYHLQEKQMALNHPLKQLHWIYEEEMRLLNIQKSTQRLQEELLKQQSLLEKREAFLKEKVCQEKLKTKNEIDMNGRLSHLDHVLKDKSDNMDITEDLNEKEALRQEIQNLRKARDCLVEQLFSLDEKFQKDKVLTTLEERKLLECDEAIEAIDAAIEFKNELICGRKENGLLGLSEGQNEELLLARLMKLSPIEIRSLLCKYFKKVIDLRESGRKMEMQLAELDMQAEAHTWKIQTLSSALQQAQVEAERQILTLQEEHDEELHVMLRRFTGDTSSSSDLEAPLHHYPSDIITNLGKYKRENKSLRRRIQEMENILHISNMAGEPSPVTIPHQNLKQLQGALAPYTTKVTRQKNKLIIQQQTNKSSQKR